MWKEFGVNILKTILVHHTLGTFLRKGKTKRNLYENMYYTNESKWYGNGNERVRESEREQGVGSREDDYTFARSQSLSHSAST